MSILLPLDDNGHPIHVLGFDYRGTQRLAVTAAASVRNPAPVPADIQLVTLIATGPCRFEVGDQTVTADPQASAFLYPGHTWTCRCAAASATSRSSPRATTAPPTSSAGSRPVPLRLRVTGEGLRVTGEPGTSAPPGPPRPRCCSRPRRARRS